MDFGDFSDNPFSVELNAAGRPQRKSIMAAAKFLLIVAVCFGLVLMIGSGSKKWLVHRLTHDFDSLSGDDKKTRLIQIADLGPLAVRPLVSALGDEDIEVARAAYDLLRQAQNEWTVLGRGELQDRHAMMVDALESIAVYMPDDRTGWGTGLLQQTIMATVDRSDDQSRVLYRDATHALELLSLSDRSGPSILSDEPLDPLTPKRLTIRPDPLTVSAVGRVDTWTDWPPPPKTASANPVTIPTAVQAVDTKSATNTPSVYRSSARLQPVQANEPVVLLDIHQAQETAYQAADIQSVTHLVDSPMETFNDKSVMHWLGSPHRALREKAKSELIARGYDRTELAIATQIAGGDTRTRIELIDAIARSQSTDPRPWLLMMLEDESRDVKLRVISVLATMNDPGVSQRLRMHLVDERDLTVAARIRRVLKLR